MKINNKPKDGFAFAIREVNSGCYLEVNPALGGYQITNSSKFASKWNSFTDAGMVMFKVQKHWPHKLEIAEVLI